MVYTKSKHHGPFSKTLKKKKKGIYFKIRNEITDLLHKNPDMFPSDILRHLRSSNEYSKSLLPNLKQVIIN